MLLRFSAAIGVASMMFYSSSFAIIPSVVAAAHSYPPEIGPNEESRALSAQGAAGSADRILLDLSAAGGPGPFTLKPVATGPAINGIASTYNPYRPGYRSGDAETASGERYDPAAWTAAIQADIRQRFGGVRYGKDYRPAFALVESAGKQAIIKINDVGPLKPGRIIDFNEQTMRYFDPSMELGVIDSVRVTPLLGDDWTPGPIAGVG